MLQAALPPVARTEDARLAAQYAQDGTRHYLRESLAPATLAAYRSDWRHFAHWCSVVGVEPTQASGDDVADYFAAFAGRVARATMARRLSSLSRAFNLAGRAWETPPIVRQTIRGILRVHGTPRRPAAALVAEDVRRLVAVAGEDMRGLRDRALILLGFSGALRRSELVAIDREHLTRVPAGLMLHIPRSKSDQTGEGASLVIPHGRRRQSCPVRAVERWLEISQTEFGPVFRKVNRWGAVEHERLHPASVGRILQRLAVTAGIEVDDRERLSAHGLRAGMVTEAFNRGASEADIMPHTRHRSLASVRRYIRRAKRSDSPAKLLDL